MLNLRQGGLSEKLREIDEIKEPGNDHMKK
jgi:hypothetical protein